jgi:hypothetical protein
MLSPSGCLAFPVKILRGKLADASSARRPWTVGFPRTAGIIQMLTPLDRPGLFSSSRFREARLLSSNEHDHGKDQHQKNNKGDKPNIHKIFPSGATGAD